jgi:hypothetical protein
MKVQSNELLVRVCRGLVIESCIENVKLASFDSVIPDVCGVHEIIDSGANNRRMLNSIYIGELQSLSEPRFFFLTQRS